MLHSSSLVGGNYSRGFIRYEPEMVKNFSTEGDLDTRKVAKAVNRASYPDDTLFHFCVQLDMDRKQVHETIRTTFKQKYSDWENHENAKDIIGTVYPTACRSFGIEFDPGFPREDFFDS